MKRIEYYLPCYDIGVYTFFKSHKRNDSVIDFIINDVEYIFHYCDACLYVQSDLCTSSYGSFVILMNHIFNECGIFKLQKYTYFSNKKRIISNPNIMEWHRNTDYYSEKRMKNNNKWLKFYSDIYNTFYIKRSVLM